jgi:hypothetical protein
MGSGGETHTRGVCRLDVDQMRQHCTWRCLVHHVADAANTTEGALPTLLSLQTGLAPPPLASSRAGASFSAIVCGPSQPAWFDTDFYWHTGKAGPGTVSRVEKSERQIGYVPAGNDRDNEETAPEVVVFVLAMPGRC